MEMTSTAEISDWSIHENGTFHVMLSLSNKFCKNLQVVSCKNIQDVQFNSHYHYT